MLAANTNKATDTDVITAQGHEAVHQRLHVLKGIEEGVRVLERKAIVIMQTA